MPELPEATPDSFNLRISNLSKGTMLLGEVANELQQARLLFDEKLHEQSPLKAEFDKLQARARDLAKDFEEECNKVGEDINLHEEDIFLSDISNLLGQLRSQIKDLVKKRYGEIELTKKKELQKTLQKLDNEVEKLLLDTADKLYDSPQLREEIFSLLKKSKLALDQARNALNKNELITGVQFDVQIASSKLNREIKIQNEREVLQNWIIPGIILLYLIGIVVLIIAGGKWGMNEFTVPIIGVPLAVLTWSAIGSYSAILYRFYTKEIGRMRSELKWFIARPIIGVIMGSITYLAILSGFILLSGNSSSGEEAQTIRPQLVWLIAFLGGFSDRFFESIVELVMGRFNFEKKDEQES